MDVEEIVERYVAEQRDRYKLFAAKTHELVSAILDARSIRAHSITHREKGPESLAEKIGREIKDYDDPLRQVTDLAGVRVITYFPRDVDKIVPLIEKDFVVDHENSMDSRRAPDASMFGYASVHLVVELVPNRLELAEYAAFAGMKCEIQVRTILQHAWAEIEHDIVYKSAQDIPFELRRRFASLAGLLEVADREFESLRGDQVQLRGQIEDRIRKEELDIPLSLDSLESYLARVHKEKRLRPDRVSRLLSFIVERDLHALEGLDQILTPGALAEADDQVAKLIVPSCPLATAQRCLMRYFLALGKHYRIAPAQIADSAHCPVLDRDGRRLRKRPPRPPPKTLRRKRRNASGDEDAPKRDPVDKR